jgi:antitoxin component of RelBE/YafQ-DinJ toxin-antitoxin module
MAHTNSMDRISVYLVPEFKKKAEQKAKDMGISMSALFNLSLREYMKQDSVVDMVEMFKSLKVGQSMLSIDSEERKNLL